VPEIRSSPQVVTGKLKTTTRFEIINAGTLHKLKP
jgi:hypothetical protein